MTYLMRKFIAMSCTISCLKIHTINYNLYEFTLCFKLKYVAIRLHIVDIEMF